MKVTRRKYLTAGGALLATSVLPTLADSSQGRNKDDADVLYGHGMVWNRALPGVAGDLNLSFDLRVNLETGAGFGSADDPVHPEWNIHFAINSAKQEETRDGENRFTLTGVVTRANNPANVGLPIRILAQDPETHAIVLRTMYERLRPGREPLVLREDFAGTSADSVAWVALSRGRLAIAIDLDGPALEWAQRRAAHLAILSGLRRRRRSLVAAR